MNKVEISDADKVFIEQRDVLLQEVNELVASILNGLNDLNISLESSISVGKEFEKVSTLWKTFYDGMETLDDENNEETEK
ncbi:DASH complex subunit DAD1 [Nakaseomyces bracarensis]|uniref:DASH complex subunit DAD1 n=1 Tax=Nakaseomyces bracarensis TaxID=273131 RepID=A0ABR4NMQ6_9SACH